MAPSNLIRWRYWTLRFLLGKFSDMQTFAGESMSSEGGMAFGYYKEGAHNPTFVYISKALEAEKVRFTKFLQRQKIYPNITYFVRRICQQTLNFVSSIWFLSFLP